ncbi:MAG: hypothetical protein PHX40_03470 [Bacilli bacterium]|nr:hypothetical protein [Bacilli bacterium]
MEIYVRNNNLIDENINYIRNNYLENNTNNLDRNICNLRVYVGKDKKSVFQYSDVKNRIEISEHWFKEAGDRIKKDFDFSIRHELMHVASIRYDKKNNITHSGFSKFYYNVEERDKTENFIYLNEGFIQHLMLVEENPILPEKYEVYRHIAGMLTQIVGEEQMKEIFFNAKGYKPICEILKGLGIEEKSINIFFEKVSSLEKDIYRGESVATIPTIQELLLEFSYKKIESIQNLEDAKIFRNRFKYTAELSINYFKEFLYELEPRDSMYSFSRLNAVKEKVKSI